MDLYMNTDKKEENPTPAMPPMGGGMGGMM